MPSIAHTRERSERDIAKAVRSLDADHKALLRDAIKQYGRVQDIPSDVWQRITDDTEQALVALYLLTMMDADEETTDAIERQGLTGRQRATMGDTAGYAVMGGALAKRTADSTTRTMRDRLARKMEDRKLDTGRTGLGVVDESDIDTVLDDVLNDARAKGIATTGTTNSITRGQMGAAGRAVFPGESVTIRLQWKTHPELAQDGKSCPRCDPLDGTFEEEWGLVFPDGPGEEAHDGCNCELLPVVVPNDELPE